MNAYNMTFGDKLKTLRKRAGKSQAEVASEIARLFDKEVRISQATLSTLEQRAMTPRGDVLEVLAKYYNVPETYFFEENTVSQIERLQRATMYLERLRQSTLLTKRMFAHNADQRQNNDMVAQSLRSIELNHTLASYSAEHETRERLIAEPAIESDDLIRALLKLAGIDGPPTRAEVIADFLNFAIEDFSDGDYGLPKTVRAFLWPAQRKIGVQKSLSSQRRTFSVLHEIGHLVLPGHTVMLKNETGRIEDKDETLSYSIDTVSQEIEANQFAANCLFQLENFDQQVANKEVSWENIIYTARLFGASFEATARRWVEKTTEDCALVVFRPKNHMELRSSMEVMYSVTSKVFHKNHFPRISPGSTITNESLVYKLFYGLEDSDDPTEILEIEITPQQIQNFVVSLFNNNYRIFGLMRPL